MRPPRPFSGPGTRPSTTSTRTGSPAESDRSGAARARDAAQGVFAERGQDVVRGPHALGSAAFHVALEIGRAVLAVKEHVALAHALVTGERLILPHAPVGVGELEVRIEVRQRARREPIPLRGETRKHRLDLLEESLRIVARLRID